MNGKPMESAEVSCQWLGCALFIVLVCAAIFLISILDDLITFTEQWLQEHS